MEEVVLRQQRGGVLLLTLNRPEQMNALSTGLITVLGDQVAAAAADPATRVIHIAGAGAAFCAGADLIEARSLTRSPADFRAWLLRWRHTFGALGACPKPVVALLNGITLAGGLELPDAVGSRWARWLMFTGSVLSADRANEIGLVQQVFDDETFEEDCWAMGEKTAGRSQPGLALMKRLSAPSISPQGIELEIEAAAHLIVAEDAREGLAAFEEKRRPHFTAVLDDLG